MTGPNSGPATGRRRPARGAHHPGQADGAGAGHVHRAAHRVGHRGHQRVQAVLLVDQLDARVEAEVGGAGGLRQVAGDLACRATGRSPAGSAASCTTRPGGGASRSRSSSRSRPRRAGSATRSGNSRVMRLVEELRRPRLGAVDAGRPADHDRAHAGCLLAGRPAAGASRSRSPRASPAPTCRGPAAARSGCAPRCPPRSGAISLAITGLRMSASISSVRPSARGRAAGVEPGHVLEARVALEPGREPGAHVAAHAGDQHPAAGHQPPRLAAGLRLGAGVRLAAGFFLAAGSRSSIASSRRPIARSSFCRSRTSS